jgi:hypothetical protein
MTGEPGRPGPEKITLYAQMGDSEVMNMLGWVVRDITYEPITDENRQPGDAPEASHRTSDIDIPALLREVADEWEARDSDE